jgi:predicted GTPase
MTKKGTPAIPLPQSLEAAIGRAVKEGQETAADLQSRFEVIRAQLAQAVEAVGPWAGSSSIGGQDAGGAAAAFCKLVLERNEEIQRLFKRQRDSLGTVNLVFFGRTGAGKSSLIEALTHGDGESVSRGESDWTAEVRPVAWCGCRLLDTPGINGWGRTEDRSSLERHARRAVEIADIVLLCFDSQSQQETEFRKVAEWVQAFGKPVIAVLNCRNQHWRLPPREELASVRKSQSQQVHQHEGNIRDGLTKLGFSGIPVVSLSAKRALMARGREPFKGPDAKTFAKHREDFGTEALLRWSNLPALESMIVEALEADAAGIRLGMLVAQLRGVLAKLDRELDQLDADANGLAEILDNTVESLLQTLGYPQAGPTAREPFRDSRLSVDLLEQLERLRGRPFQTPAEGDFQVFCSQMLTAHLGQLRSRAHGKAEDVVLSAFNERREVDGPAFAKAVYDQQAMDTAAKDVLDEAANFLQRKVKLALRDGQTDLSCLQRTAEGIKGGAGKGWNWLSKGSRAAGILSGGAAAVILALAAANIWNPGGWALLAVSIGGGVLSTVFGWLGHRAERKAEEKRNTARRQALTSARQSVDNAFDDFTTKMAEAAAATGRSTMAEVLSPPLREAVAARLILQASAQARCHFEELEKTLPRREPQKILDDAARSIERRLHPDNRKAGELVWSGDDWITDPVGLVARKGSAEPVRAIAGPSLGDRLLDALRDIFLPDRPKAGEGKAWLRSARGAILKLPEGQRTLEEIERLVAMGRPRLQLLGDYNTGKTSFIKRLLIDAGQPIPAMAEVRADPTTSRLAEYEWEKVLLVDSPGLQSLRQSDSQLTMGNVPDASYLICILQPNLLGSTLDLLCPVLLGDEASGLAPKLRRTVVVINRADELGPDPEDDLAEYERACRRKQVEVLQALQRRGIELPPDRIICIAADPYGRVGDRRDVNSEQYARFREWDGVSAFVRAFRSMKAQSLRIGVDVSILEGGMSRLGCRRGTTRSAVATTKRDLEVLRKIDGLLAAAAAEGQRLQAHIEAKLDRLLDEATEGHLADAMGAANDLELQQAAVSLAAWWEDSSFRAALARWETSSRKDVERWFCRTRDEVGRRMNSVEFVQAFPETKLAFDPGVFESKAGARKPWWDVLERGVGAAGRRDVVYAVGKFFGVKFKPYGAIKAAAKMAKLGAALAAVGVGLDIYDWVKSVKSAKKREAARKDAARFLRESRAKIRASLLGDGKAEKGPCAYLDQHTAELQRVRAEVRAEVIETERSQRELDEQLAEINRMISDARHRLALPARGEDDDE